MPSYQTVCSILADLWINFRDQGDLKQFAEYNDIGLPLAYFLSEGLISEITEDGQKYVLETFSLLLAALGINEDQVEDGMTLSNLFEMSEGK